MDPLFFAIAMFLVGAFGGYVIGRRDASPDP